MGLCLSGGTTAPAILVPSKAENTGVWSPLAVLRYRNALNILELNDLGAHGSLSINTAGMLAAGSLPLWPFGRCTCFSFACPIGIDWPQVAKQSRAPKETKLGLTPLPCAGCHAPGSGIWCQWLAVDGDYCLCRVKYRCHSSTSVSNMDSCHETLVCIRMIVSAYNCLKNI